MIMKSILVIDGWGDKRWKLPNGKLHREGDLPAYISLNGYKSWYINGKLHRENDKPAIKQINGTKIWYLNGNLHRIEGAAVELVDGRKYWYLEGFKYSEEEYNEKLSGYCN